MNREQSAEVIAHANIALAKYWGKLEGGQNLTAVPSLSLTLDALRTQTRVTFDPDLAHDQVQLADKLLEGRPLARVSALLDRVRALAGQNTRARVITENNFPTAAGLASSASGFAALALAAAHALGLGSSRAQISALARASSASAARSLFGGFVQLDRGAESAEPVASADHWPLVMIITLTQAGAKDTGSTEGMLHTARTSPYYSAWLEAAPAICAEVRSAVLARDLERLGANMEQSALLMHASMFGAAPALIYFSPVTLTVIHHVRALRARGVPAFFTMDAGPHVKVLTLPDHARDVEASLRELPGVLGTIACRPGPDARVLES